MNNRLTFDIVLPNNGANLRRLDHAAVMGCVVSGTHISHTYITAQIVIPADRVEDVRDLLRPVEMTPASLNSDRAQLAKLGGGK